MLLRLLSVTAITLFLCACGSRPAVYADNSRPPPPRADSPRVAAPQAPRAPTGVPSLTGQQAADSVLNPDAYRVAPGDSVRIEVLGETELSLIALIDSAGYINYPFLGHLRAIDQTVRELERRIRAGLANGYLRNPDVRVSIAAYRPVFVSGQVRQSGAYPYTPGLTAEKVLTLAGGLTQFASSRRIYVQRAGQSQEQRIRIERDSPVYPGDTVIVEERLF